MAFIKMDQNKATQAQENQGGFSPLAPGWYEVFITAVDMNVVSSQKGTPGVEVVFTVRKDVEGQTRSAKVWETFWLTEKAMNRLFVLLSKVGVSDGEELEKDDVKKKLLYAPIQIELEINEYTDNQGNKKQNNRVTYMGFAGSEVGGTFTPEEGQAKESEPFVVTDDMLPF